MATHIWTSILYECRRNRMFNVELLKSVHKEDYKKYDIVQYQTLSDKDYLRVYDNGETRIIPRAPHYNSGNLSIPRNAKLFSEAWKRSKFIDCLGLNMSRNATEGPYLPVEESIQVMSSLVRYLTTFDVYPFLCGGTMLGELLKKTIIHHKLVK
nr:Protein W02B3.4 [Haemonchus contortus]